MELQQFYFRILLGQDKNKWGKWSLLLISCVHLIKYDTRVLSLTVILPPLFLFNYNMAQLVLFIFVPSKRNSLVFYRALELISWPWIFFLFSYKIRVGRVTPIRHSFINVNVYVIQYNTGTSFLLLTKHLTSYPIHKNQYFWKYNFYKVCISFYFLYILYTILIIIY